MDLGHEAFKDFFALAEKIAFVEEAVRRDVTPAILFMMTPDATSVEACRNLRGRVPQAVLMPAYNEIFRPAPHRGCYPLAGNRAGVVRLAMPAPTLRKYIETPPFAFSDAVDLPVPARGELDYWLRRAVREFRELDLRLLLADRQSSIQIDS